MFITNEYITFADAVTEDGTDYGTGYYLLQEYSSGVTDIFGPYQYEEDVPNKTRIF
ncbi:hypothetical protein BOW86_gp032 [Synechococcus phage S-CAM7]|jgi:hypothetical protein|uniref:Uncharacterized protein n=1 Tax=Synechococcus phage S-CAM7 TaxID=1883368 RepID=A0A1D8KTG7_9CAUD|nr:hypothetical protein BOW86_gp032 [Synechococcus phage S-CAM7]AOV61956.1 hypothetical protein C490910_032 [Synechococcus phage S-CAM7]AOV62222.1 hypothetical protein S420910_032 [Synechococcus phage S-CAM7]